MNTPLEASAAVPIMRPNEETDKDKVNEVREAINVTSLNGSLNDDSSLNGKQEVFTCSICHNPYESLPRILSCLHVFCENCLNKESSNDEKDVTGGQKIIRCPICEQVTNLKWRGASSLSCDYVLLNTFELGIINSSLLLCTSCKAKEKAVARCADCPHFLCPNCSTAHQYMRCFENHFVVSLDDIKASNDKMPFHKPINCMVHKKKIQFFCITCQEIICAECTNKEHVAPLHIYDNLSLVGSQKRQELKSLVIEAKLKLKDYIEKNMGLESALGDLQLQYDNAKDFINETCQSYKAILEKCRDEALNDLSKIHTRQELKVMEAIQNIEKRMEKIEYACSFTSRILDNGNDSELLALNPVISNQLETLCKEVISKSTYSTSLEFITDLEKFQDVVKKSFGNVKDLNAETVNKKLINVHGSAQDLSILEVNSNVSMQNNPLAISMLNGNTNTASTVSMQSSPVTSSPLSMPSSFDGDLNFQTSNPQTPPLEGLTTLGEINLTRLASLAACNGKPSSPPITRSNGVSSAFPLDLLVSNEIPSNLINNIQALAKLGGVQTEQVNDMMTNGYASMNGMVSATMMSSFDTNVDASSVLDLVNGSSALIMNGRGPSFGTGSPFFSSHNGFDSNGLLHSVGNGMQGGSASSNSGGISHHNGYHSYSRSNSQRATALEIHFKFGQIGQAPCQFGSPHGFCIGEDDSIIVADTNNHRIQVFNKDGEYRTQFGIAGKLEGQLWYPRKIELLPSGCFVICDRGNERSRLQLFSREGVFIKKIRLKYVDIVAGMTVTDDGNIVIVDSVQPSLYKLDETGALSTWFDCKGVMTEPSDIAVRDNKFYICDFKGHCVAVFSQEGQFLNRIGNQGLTDYPNGIDVLPDGNILVGDSHGNKFHICIFLPDGTLLCEYECPYVKVSRCCGLKITSDGCIITVAKNNHHVLVLKSPF